MQIGHNIFIFKSHEPKLVTHNVLNKAHNGISSALYE